jgi:hypothetical protein
VDIEQILKIVQTAGVTGLLLVILWGGAKGVWVWGYLYRQERAEKEAWMLRALRGTSLAERAVVERLSMAEKSERTESAP